MKENVTTRLSISKSMVSWLFEKIQALSATSDLSLHLEKYRNSRFDMKPR
jgi:hypothetical protein